MKQIFGFRPLLANLFLHYALDTWMARQYPDIPFERYADDAILHCRTRQAAERLRDPTNPVEISSLSPLGTIFDIVVSGGYAYLAGSTNYVNLTGAETKMMVLDLSDPADPQVVLDGFHPTEYRYGLHLAVAGDQLLLSDSLWDLHLIDVSNPADPMITGSLEGVGGWIARSPGYA